MTITEERGNGSTLVSYKSGEFGGDEVECKSKQLCGGEDLEAGGGFVDWNRFLDWLIEDDGIYNFMCGKY